MTRQVICVNYHQQINENYCDPEGRPAKEQECSMPSCPPVYRHVAKIHDHPSHFPEVGYLPIHPSRDNLNQWNRPSAGGYQWRTGPWGAVRNFLEYINLFCHMCVNISRSVIAVQIWSKEKHIHFKKYCYSCSYCYSEYIKF